MAAKVSILSPVAEGAGQMDSPLAPRLAQLQGKTIGFISNGWRSMEISLGEFGRLLRERYEIGGVVGKQTTTSRPLLPRDFEELAAQADAVICGLAN